MASKRYPVALLGINALLLVWTLSATYLLLFKPSAAVSLNNWIARRETMQGRTFLIKDAGPEGFTAFGNESYVYCARPCGIEEAGPDGGHNLPMCGSTLVGGGKHLCAGRFWPARSYIVHARRATEEESGASSVP